MKKLITIILALALILPAAALAADGNSPFFGKWVGEEHHAIKNYDTKLHFVEIHKNGPSTYMVFTLSHGGMLTRPKLLEDPEMYNSQWDVVDDHIRVPTSSITYVDFYLNDDGTIYTKDPKVTYVKLP